MYCTSELLSSTLLRQTPAESFFCKIFLDENGNTSPEYNMVCLIPRTFVWFLRIRKIAKALVLVWIFKKFVLPID